MSHARSQQDVPPPRARTRRSWPARLRGHGRGDEGFTLIAVLGVMAVGLLLATTVTITSLRSAQSSSAGRSTSQAQAAAEAGVNAGVAWVRTLDRRDYSSAYCGDRTLDSTVYSSPGSSRVTTTFAYYIEGAAQAATCPLVDGRTYRTVVVTSRAVYASGAAGSSEQVRTVQGTVDLAGSTSTASTPTGTSSATPTSTPTATATPTATSYTDAVFVNDSLRVANSFSTTGDVHTNGDFSCTGGGTITGNLRVIGTGETALTGSCGVNGDTYLNGYFRIPDSSVLTGTLSAASTQRSAIGSAARVRGAATLRGTVGSDNGTSMSALATNFPGGLRTDVSSVSAAAATAMPVVTYDAASWSGSTTLTAAQWGQQAGRRNGAPDYVVNSVGCQLAGASSGLNGPLYVGSGSTVVDARSCRPLTLQDITVRMSGDLTIFAGSFSATGASQFVSADGATHLLRIIVPAQAGTAACAQPDSGGDISTSGNLTDSSIMTFLYSTATTSVGSSTTLTGAVYTCKANFSASVAVAYSSAPVLSTSGGPMQAAVAAPGSSAPSPTTSTVTTTSTSDRYDTSGLRGLIDVPNR